MHLRERLARHGYMSLVGGFLYFNCKDDILKKSANYRNSKGYNDNKINDSPVLI